MKKIIQIFSFLMIIILLIYWAFNSFYNKPTVEEMVGQMILVGFRGTGVEPLDNDIVVLKEDIKDGKIGGVILFYKDAQTLQTNRNFVSKTQIKNLITSLQKEAKIPLFVSVDQEGGTIKRLLPEHGFRETPSAQNLGNLNDVNATFNEAYELGKELKSVGFNVDFAPDVDLNANPENPIIGGRERAFSNNPDTVIAHARAFAKGLKDAGIIYSYKHFPGHGSSKEDSHHGIVDITNTWTDAELNPYRELVNTDMNGMVMVGHLMLNNIDPEYPASISKKIITGVLREEMEYDGVVITDDIQMNAITKYYGMEEAYKLAILAGVDILLIGNNLYHDTYNGRTAFDMVVKMVKNGEIPMERIEESYNRIMKLKKNLK